MNRIRALAAGARSGAAAAVAVLGLALTASPAAAHVTVTASTTAAGATAEVRMQVPHGCEGSATTEIAVRMPDEVAELVLTDTERWSAEQVEGGATFRTDDPLPDALRDEVAFSVRLPDVAGTELVFPVVQRCEQGEAAWTEVAEDAASRDELDMPAPVIVVTAGEESAGAPADDREQGGRVMAWSAGGVLALGCLASGTVLLLRRRRA
ncbi:DUF1775 domain-containing protein [Nocardioides sp. S-58]|uniref:DUF1775 domain-containing protein n=1 Tax=Nocardioides renjunii TaxID=3095075 RepID=A0ABU5KCE5_9ACTN|nr:DUF1775 domain-containing protein [Nocardioides sp. S-58]MDZ5662653.1 DUF1775 domain-containing protein [Nocardioides sp. S-58]